MRVALLVALFLLGAPAAALANGTIDILTCHHSAARDPHGLDKVLLNGSVVRSAIKERCVGDEDYRDVKVRYYSAVHLTRLGICASAEFDERRKATGIILRTLAEKSQCPVQDLLKYVQTSGISDDEFLSILSYWSSQEKEPSFSIEKIVSRHNYPPDRAAVELGDPSPAAMERHLVNRLRANLKSKRLAMQIISALPGPDRERLAPQDRALRAYQIDTGYCFRLIIVSRKDGLDVVDVSCLIP